MTKVLIFLLAIAAATASASVSAAACRPGTVESAGVCIVEIPANAHLNALGDGWWCNFGFERRGQICAPVIVPRNASMAEGSDVWRCNRGYYEIRGICMPQEKTEVRRAPPLDLKALRASARGALLDDRNGTLILAFVLTIAGLGILMMARGRTPDVPEEAPRPHAFRPQRAVAAGSWLLWGERIDGLTGGPIAEAAAVTQCPTCQTCYGPESVAVLRRENRARCLACGSRILRKPAQIKFETVRDTTALPAR